MDPITMSLLAQGGIGAAQMIGGLAMKAPKRPVYTPSAATQEAVRLTEQEANSSLMAGQSQMQDQIQATAANTMNSVQRSASSSSDILNAAGAVQAQSNRSLSDLVRMSAQDKARRRGLHLGSLSRLGQEQNQAFQINQMEPYQNANAAKSALFSSGMQTLGDAGSSYARYKQMQNGIQTQQHLTPSAYQIPPTLSQLAMENNNDFSLSRLERYLTTQNGY